MKVWVTGAKGFIGRNLSGHLAAIGCSAYGIGHGAWPQAEHRRAGLLEWRNAEVSHSNLDALATSVGIPDAVIHLAGGSAVGPSYGQPADDFNRSVVGTAALLEWVRLSVPKARVVLASSAAVYGSSHKGQIEEGAHCLPQSPYGFSKRMAELLVESYAKNFGIKAAMVRLFSAYGPGLKKQLLWDACTKLEANQDELVLGGTGGELRDWLHVKDVARLLASAIDWADEDVRVVNGGTGIPTPVSEVAAAVTAHWGAASKIRFSGEGRVGDPRSLVADTGRLRNLSFEHRISVEEGVREYVSWFLGRNRVSPESAQ